MASGGEEELVNEQADRPTIVLTVLLLLCGMVMVYSASAAFSLKHFDNSFHLFAKQLVACAIGGAALWFLARFDYHRFVHIDDALLLGTFVLTLATILPLPGLSGGRWLNLGPFALQPTELVKLALIIYLATTVYRKRDRMDSFGEGVLPFLVILFLLALVIMAQPDFGMVVILGSLTGVILFLGGARVAHLALVAAGVTPFAYLALRLAPYRFARVLSFLDPYAYSTSSGYQVIQSMTAIGAGGLLGRGLGASKAKLFYLPQSYNDFIFSIIAEELGLWGSLALIGLFVAFLWRLWTIAQAAPDLMGQLLVYGIGFVIAFQVIVNLGVTLGVLPVTGLTLPFISNGGSSLIVTLAMVGIALNVSKQGARS